MSVRPKKRPLKNSSERYKHIYTDLPQKLANFVFPIFILCSRGGMYTTTSVDKILTIEFIKFKKHYSGYSYINVIRNIVHTFRV